jgi:ASC-1-like (ASCH) protein
MVQLVNMHNSTKFNPFDTSNHIALSENNANLDKSSKINCEYYLPNDFKKQINNENLNNFSMMHLNIRSIINKFDSFKQLIYSLNKPFQIIGLTETWLKETNEDLFKLENYDFVNVNRTTKSGGGVGIYIANELKYKIRFDLNTSTENIIESVFIEIITAVGKNIIVGVIYRPPNNKFDSFETKMNQILGKIDKENKLCYLMGDFNIDLLKSESCDYSIRFLEQLYTSSYIPLVLRPTRITQHTATLIDNIFTNDIETIESSTNGLIFCDISDHLPIVHIRNSKNYHEKTSKTEFTCKRIINDANVQSFTNTIKNISWENVLSENNSTESYNKFFNLFSTSYEKNFPLTKKVTKRKIHKNRSPWMTSCIAKSVKQKNKLYKKYLQYPKGKNIKIN